MERPKPPDTKERRNNKKNEKRNISKEESNREILFSHQENQGKTSFGKRRKSILGRNRKSCA